MMNDAPEPLVLTPAPQPLRPLRYTPLSALRRFYHVVLGHHGPRLPRPQVPPDLGQLPAPRRLVACLQLLIADVEYALSPQGQLRDLLKLVGRLTLMALLVLLAAATVLGLASLVVGLLVLITTQIVAVLWNVLEAVLLGIALLAIGAVLVVVLRHTSRSR